MDTNRGEHNLLILMIKNVVQQKQYVGNIWIDVPYLDGRTFQHILVKYNRGVPFKPANTLLGGN